MEALDADGPKKKKAKPGSFQGLGLSQNTFQAVMKMGYKMPTPIQRKTIPTILDGQDVVAMARTGSGKTAAFIIPIIERLVCHSKAVGVRACALSPTRELAMQTAKFFRQLARFTDLRCCVMVGGQAMEAQFEHLANNPDVVIATPGRLMHHILEAELSLQRVEVLVIDEADRLFELGFAEQLQKCLDGTPPGRQCLLFSATLPAQLVSFTRAGLKEPAFVRLDVETSLSENLDLWYLYVRKEEKMAAAVNVLRRFSQQKKSTIMFVATRHHVEFFGDLFARLGLSAAIVYGSMDQVARETQIHRFRSKKANILVTTDVAARGMDIPFLDNVLNYDFPPSGKLFVHRAGRTARAGRSGLAVSLVGLDDMPYMVELMLFLGHQPRICTSEPTKTGIGVPPVLGSMPPMGTEVETMVHLLQDESSDLYQLYKSMKSSYKLYYKSRPSASRQSVARAKQLVEDAGGPARLQGLVHPALREGRSAGALHTPQGGISTADFIQELRGYRPKAAKVGNAVSTSGCRFMEMAKDDAKTVSIANALEFAGSRDKVADKAVSPAEPEPEAAATTQKRGEKRKKRGEKRDEAKLKHHKEIEQAKSRAADAGEDDFGDFDVSVDGVKMGTGADAAAKAGAVQRKAQPVNGPRMSKRARMKQTTKSASPEDYSGFDVSVDGVRVGAGVNTKAVASNARPEDKAAVPAPVKQFWLTTERSTSQEEAKERGLEMEQYQMDLMPDDGKDLKKQTSVIRWDAKKKKYLPVMVSVDGRVVRKTTKTNEAGVVVHGEATKTTIYKKWTRTSKRRIQKVGEMEQTHIKPASRKWGAQDQGAVERARRSAADTVEFDNAGAAKKAGSQEDEDKGRKPVVPYHGKIEEKYLTHKQKRMVAKRSKKDSVVSSWGDKELKTIDQIKKDKKMREAKRIRTTPHLRKKKGKEVKDERARKNEQRSMHSGRTKSKMLVIEGPSKNRRKAKTSRRGMPTI